MAYHRIYTRQLQLEQQTVEFCWYDYDTSQIECYVEQIVIP